MLVLDNGAHSIRALWAVPAADVETVQYALSPATTLTMQDVPQRHRHIQVEQAQLHRERARQLSRLRRTGLSPPIRQGNPQ